MKILINTPSLKLSGGVANHYIGLKKYWNLKIKYNIIGKRGRVNGLLMFPYDLLRFTILCLFGNFDLIVLNPSLGSSAVRRDSLFLKIAKFFRKKTIVFFHGWSNELDHKFTENPKEFYLKFYQSDAFIVLASQFQNKLFSWGIRKPVFLSTTKVDNFLLKDFDFSTKAKNNTILFLARLELEKGIMTTINAFEIVKTKIPDAKLIVAGSGGAIKIAKNHVNHKGIKDVVFLGNISGTEIREVFEKSSIYILPTTHGEGMPTSVLEAMAFGLPIISRPVGGLTDFFVQGKMGYLIESLSPEKYSSVIIELCTNNDLNSMISSYNYHYSNDYFLASKVAQDLEKIFEKIIND